MCVCRSERSLGLLVVATVCLSTVLLGSARVPGQVRDGVTAKKQPSRSVIVVLDRSNSMTGSDPNRLSIEGAEILLALLPKETALGVVHFSTKAEIGAKLQWIRTHQDRTAVHQRISHYFQEKYTGFTSYDAALAVTQALLQNEQNATVVFLTDGEQQEPPEQALPAGYNRPPGWRDTLETLANSGTRFVAIDINPVALDKRKPEGIESLEFLAQKGSGHVFRLQPPGASKADAAKLLEAFLFIAGETGNLFRTESRAEVGVFPGAETLLVLAEDKPFSRVECDGQSVPVVQSQQVYRYRSSVNPLDVLNIGDPQPGNWRFETDSGGRIAFVLADPQLEVQFVLEAMLPEYIAGLPVKVRLSVVPRMPGKTITADMASCISAAVKATPDEAFEADSGFAAEIELTRASEKPEEVLFEGTVVLPKLRSGETHGTVTLDGFTRLTYGNNAPWELVKRVQIRTVPPKGSLELVMDSESALTADTRVVLTGTAHVKVPPGCKVQLEFLPEQDASDDVTAQLVGKGLTEGLIGASEEEARAVPFQCVFQCADDFFGDHTATLRARCLQGGMEPASAEIKVSFEKVELRGVAGTEQVKAERGRPLKATIGRLERSTGTAPMKVSLNWMPTGDWPAKLNPDSETLAMSMETEDAPVVLSGEPWPGLAPSGEWSGRVVARYGRDQETVIPVKVTVGPLLTASKPKPIVNEPGGIEETSIEVSHSSNAPLETRITASSFLGKDGAKGELLSPVDRVFIRVGADEEYLSADQINRTKDRVWSLPSGRKLDIGLRFDLKRKLDGDDEDTVKGGPYRGTIRIEPVGAPEEFLELPVDLFLGR